MKMLFPVSFLCADVHRLSMRQRRNTGQGLPENWEKPDRFTDDENVHHHYWNPEVLDSIIIKDHTSPLRHKHKFIVESRQEGAIGSAKSEDEAIRIANEYMRQNKAYS